METAKYKCCCNRLADTRNNQSMPANETENRITRIGVIALSTQPPRSDMLAGLSLAEKGKVRHPGVFKVYDTPLFFPDRLQPIDALCNLHLKGLKLDYHT